MTNNGHLLCNSRDIAIVSELIKKQIERIFEPFSSFSAGGTGLGMSVVYHIINEHRGKIDVKSEVGRGTTITLLLAAHSETQTEEKALSVAYA